MTKRVGTTEGGRVIITATGEEPKSARRSKRHYQLWKLTETLDLDEIEMLITKRRNDIKHETNPEEVKKRGEQSLIDSEEWSTEVCAFEVIKFVRKYNLC